MSITLHAKTQKPKFNIKKVENRYLGKKTVIISKSVMCYVSIVWYQTREVQVQLQIQSQGRIEIGHRT